MKKLIVLLFVSMIFIFSACGGGGGKAVGKIEALQTKACACTNKSCAANALKDFRTLFLEVKDLRVGKSDYNRIKKASAGITKCLLKNGISPQQVMKVIR